MLRRRRDLLLAATGIAVVGSLPAPAIAQRIRELKLVTDWAEEDKPGLHANSVNLARMIGVATGGRIKIEVFPSGSLVRPFESFEAVGAGVADMYHTYEGYFVAKAPALQFFAAIPFGFTANEQLAWIKYGGGQELWDALSGHFNIKSIPCANTGTQMGGWFTRETVSPEQFKGLRYRMAGPGAEVLRRMGATVVTLPVTEIMPALRSGAIDATEWIGPWLDMGLGLHKVAGYYHYPGFHEPCSTHTLGINKDVWESLDASDQRLIEAVATSEYARSLAEFNANNALSLRKLREEGIVKILKFDDSLLKTLQTLSRDVVAEIGAGDELSKKIYASYEQFRASITGWSDIAERAFLNSRGLA